MRSVTQETNDEKGVIQSISGFCKEFHVGKALKYANAYNSRGIPVISVLTYLLQLVYTKKSMYMNIANNTHKANFSKDVVYRLLNSPYINWSIYILTIACCIISKVTTLTSENRLNAIVVDDTFYNRTRSKDVELLANAYDHAGIGNKYKKGFRMLTIVWTDGVTLIPLLFRHLSSDKQKNRYNEINLEIDKRSSGYKARIQAITPSPKVLIEMLSQIKKVKVPAKHVLFDSWFSFPCTIIAIKGLALDVVARLKNTPNVKYLFEGEKKTLSQIFSKMKKRPGLSKYLLSVPVKLYNKEGALLDARIVYIRDRNNRKKWIALISTDMNLLEEEIIQLYAKRWDIEVFFKICKSYLNLAKEFHGLSYDSITAHTAVVLTRYMILAFEKRKDEDPRALGEIFFFGYSEISDMQFSEALELILSLLRETLIESLFLSEEQISQLIESFILKLPKYFGLKIQPYTSY